MVVKFGVHPLFFAVGAYYALAGRIWEFLVYSVTAVIHELGHSFAAEKCGYRIDGISLTPFGAVAFGDVRGLKFYDEIFIALAGPAVNLVTGLFITAFWWIFPEIYPVTETAAEANFVLALINLIPAYPLDGGRILSAVLSIKAGRERALKICRIIGAVTGAAIIGLFVVTAFGVPNFTVLFFGIFVIVGAVTTKKDNKLVRIDRTLSESALKRGVPIKRQAVSANATVKTLLRLTDPDCVNEIDVYDGDKRVASLGQKRVSEIISAGDLYSKIIDNI